MSIYNSMQSGISGLTAQSQRVSKIADNVANVNTVGYKRNFVDLVTSTSTEQGAKTYPAGVLAIHGKEVDRTGTFSQTNSGTDLAIAGDGFFVVSRSPFETNSTNFLLTRAGSFKPDENGYLVNSAGYYLQGYTADQR
jgi:flagellar hook protein FlgE